MSIPCYCLKSSSSIKTESKNSIPCPPKFQAKSENCIMSNILF